eukprot:g5779.t1
MSLDIRDSREFLIGLLREANIIDEIIDEVVDACESANYSAFSLASNSVTVPVLSEKLSLTREEAESLKYVTLRRLNAIESSQESPMSSLDAHGPSLGLTSETEGSMEVQTSFDETPKEPEESFLPFGSFLQESITTQSVEGDKTLDSKIHWTDCSIDGGSSDQSIKDKSSKIHLLEDKSGFNEPCGMTKLANVKLDETQEPRGRPFIPPLLLQDAGISFGPPNGCPSDSSCFDTVSSVSIEDFVDSHGVMSMTTRSQEKPNKKQNCKVVPEASKKKLGKSSGPLPSYLRPTVASEARRLATLGKKGNMKGHLDQPLVFQSSSNSLKRRKIPYYRMVKSTRADLARMEYIKHRIESTSLENEAPRKKSCSLKAKVNHSNKKTVSKRHV